MENVDEVIQLFHERGMSLYGGERVTQLQHALQAATLARDDGAADTLVAAALLHDVGHLVHDLPVDAPDRGVDDRHEELGDAWLDKHFVQAVCEPVRLHVAAKRYLCTADQSYARTLSPPSIQSLKLQGGRMSPQEVADFECNAFFREAVQLRRWDDKAKVPNLATPPMEAFRPQLVASLKAVG